jgi:hypothetical protein
LFNIFIDDMIDYISETDIHAPAVGKMSIPGLLFADDLTIGSVTVAGLQRGIDNLTKYCKDWSLKFNLKKTKILVCKKGGKLKKNDRWSMENQQIEVVKEIDYLEVTLERSGGWSKQKAKQKVKGIQSLVTIDKCLTRTPDMGVKLLEIVYEMVCESRMMYGVEIRGIEEGWKEIDKIHGRVGRKILGIPRFAANWVAELELGRDSRRRKAMNTLVKYWQRILQMDKDDLVRMCHD